jgi:5-methylcytosine-specific restriction protein A
MPSSAPRLCARCRQVHYGPCSQSDHGGLSAAKRGYDRRWRAFRKWFLMENPICRDCLARNQYVVATEVHHIRKIADHPELRLDVSNCMSLCTSCHGRRSARGE